MSESKISTPHNSSGRCLCDGCYYRDRYLADLASGVPLAEVIDDHYSWAGYRAIARLPESRAAEEDAIYDHAIEDAIAVGRAAHEALLKVPGPEAYRLDLAKVSPICCQGRRLVDAPDHLNHYVPRVCVELQCHRKPGSGSDLCTVCARTEATGGKNWRGRITEKAPDHLWLLDNAWGKKKKPVWHG